jgi:hypothetical protein
VTESAVTAVCGKSVGGLFRAGVSVRPMNTPAQTQLFRLLPSALILSGAATAQPAPPHALQRLALRSVRAKDYAHRYAAVTGSHARLADAQ